MKTKQIWIIPEKKAMSSTFNWPQESSKLQLNVSCTKILSLSNIFLEFKRLFFLGVVREHFKGFKDINYQRSASCMDTICIFFFSHFNSSLWITSIFTCKRLEWTKSVAKILESELLKAKNLIRGQFWTETMKNP